MTADEAGATKAAGYPERTFCSTLGASEVNGATEDTGVTEVATQNGPQNEVFMVVAKNHTDQVVVTLPPNPNSFAENNANCCGVGIFISNKLIMY